MKGIEVGLWTGEEYLNGMRVVWHILEYQQCVNIKICQLKGIVIKPVSKRIV